MKLDKPHPTVIENSDEDDELRAKPAIEPRPRWNWFGRRSSVQSPLSPPSRREQPWYDKLDDYVWDPEHDRAPGLSRHFWRALQILQLACKGFRQHDLSLRASALTYSTLLSLVPILALAFAILRALNVQETMAKQLVSAVTAGSPEAIEAVTAYINKTVEYVNKTSVTGLTSIGIISLVFVTIMMIQSVEQSLNVIWGLKRGRSVGRMIADYISLMVIAPVLFALGTYVTTMMGTAHTNYPLAGLIDHVVLGPLLFMLPLLVNLGIFIFIYAYMPNTRVHFKTALIGGLVAGLSWHFAQMAYVRLSSNFFAARYNAVYESLAWVFILLLWIWFSWSVLLMGAEITWAHQNLDQARRLRRTWGSTPAERETMALKVAALLVKPMLKPLDEPFHILKLEPLSDWLGLPIGPLEQILKLYKQAGLVIEVGNCEGYSLCRSPHEVTVLDILRLVRHGSIDYTFTDPPHADTPEEKELEEGERRISQWLHNRTLTELSAIPIERVRTFELWPSKELVEDLQRQESRG